MPYSLTCNARIVSRRIATDMDAATTKGFPLSPRMMRQHSCTRISIGEELRMPRDTIVHAKRYEAHAHFGVRDAR